MAEFKIAPTTSTKVTAASLEEDLQAKIISAAFTGGNKPCIICFGRGTKNSNYKCPMADSIDESYDVYTIDRSEGTKPSHCVDFNDLKELKEVLKSISCGGQVIGIFFDYSVFKYVDDPLEFFAVIKETMPNNCTFVFPFETRGGGIGVHVKLDKPMVRDFNCVSVPFSSKPEVMEFYVSEANTIAKDAILALLSSIFTEAKQYDNIEMPFVRVKCSPLTVYVVKI